MLFKFSRHLTDDYFTFVIIWKLAIEEQKYTNTIIFWDLLLIVVNGRYLFCVSVVPIVSPGKSVYSFQGSDGQYP